MPCVGWSVVKKEYFGLVEVYHMEQQNKYIIDSGMSLVDAKKTAAAHYFSSTKCIVTTVMFGGGEIMGWKFYTVIGSL